VVGENVFDERYQEVLGYPALGRSVRAGLRLRTTGRP
jgi:outer membrane cobalamin receptor